MEVGAETGHHLDDGSVTSLLFKTTCQTYGKIEYDTRAAWVHMIRPFCFPSSLTMIILWTPSKISFNKCRSHSPRSRLPPTAMSPTSAPSINMMRSTLRIAFSIITLRPNQNAEFLAHLYFVDVTFITDGGHHHTLEIL